MEPVEGGWVDAGRLFVPHDALVASGPAVEQGTGSAAERGTSRGVNKELGENRGPRDL